MPLRSTAFSLALLSAALLHPNASAQDQPSRLAIDAGLGTTGLDTHLQWRVMDALVLRGGVHGLTYDAIENDYDGISYDGEIESVLALGAVDFHPFGNGWHISAGLTAGNREVTLEASPLDEEEFEIGDQLFTGAAIGDLAADVSLGDTAPFLAVGFDNALYRENPIGWHVRLGVMFTGSPDVDLSASGGLLSDDPTFLEQLAIEEENLEDDIDDFELYPMLDLGLSIRL